MRDASAWLRPACRSLAAVGLTALLLAGCARAPFVLPVRVEPDTLAAWAHTRTPTDYGSAVRVIAAVMVLELELPLPDRFTVFVYPSRAGYQAGLVREGRLPPARAAEIAGYSVGLGQHRRLFVNDEALRGARRSVWLGVVAHELTHLAQYELTGGRRGRSEQWLREGMADWVAFRVLERLGEDTLHRQRERTLSAVAAALPAFRDDPLDLVVLGSPTGWAARSVRSGGRLTYGLAFLLTDDLIRRRGFESLRAYFRVFADSDDRFGHFRRAFGLSLTTFQSEALGRIRKEGTGGATGKSVLGPDAGSEARVIDKWEADEEAPDERP